MTERLDEVRRFRPYPAYRDSGVEWLGKVPEHWVTWKATHGFRRIRSGTTPKSDVPDYYNGDVPWVTTSELRETIILDTQKKVTARALREYPTLRKYPRGTLLFAMYGATVGRLGILGIAATVNQACAALAEPLHLSTRFAYYWLQMRRPTLILLSAGGGQPNLSQDDLRQLRIPAPPMPEQDMIAAFLDRETAKIDALVAKKERLIELLREKRTALITRAVTRSLDPNAPMKDSGVVWLGEIPAHWMVKKLGYLTSIGNGSTPSRGEARYWVDGSHPWLTSKKINEGVIVAAEEFVTQAALRQCHLPRVPAGSILVAITGEGQTRGRTAILSIDSTISQHLAYITPDGPEVTAGFLLRLFEARYEWLREESSGSGSTRAALTCEFLRSIRLAFPPPVEQRVIASFLDRETAKMDALIAKVRQAIAHLNEIRTALISAGVTGKIDVRGAVL